MWPFFEHKRTEAKARESGIPGAPIQRQKPLQFAQLIDAMGDLNDFRERGSALKFWIPEPAFDALKEICDMSGYSMTETLREFFATHCYGIYAVHAMKQMIPSIFKNEDVPMFSRVARADDDIIPKGKKRVETYWVPELGKNVSSLKVWIPSRMQADLQFLADHAGMKLSPYVREIVISRLLGHGTLPKRPEMLIAVPLPSAEDWCEDQEVPLRQVSAEEYLKSAEGERREELVDSRQR